jgi:hypothetical protein
VAVRFAECARRTPGRLQAAQRLRERQAGAAPARIASSVRRRLPRGSPGRAGRKGNRQR